MGYKKHGFTLIELLVVIAIIAILAAILFPVFSAAKERSKVASCSSNLRQIYVALVSYCDDYSGRIPPSYKVNYPQYTRKTKMSDPADPEQISYKLMKYLGTAKGSRNDVFRCPSDALIPPLGPGGVYDKQSQMYKTAPTPYATLGTSYQWRLGNKDAADSYNTPPNGKDLTDTEKALLLSGKVLSTMPNPSQISAARDAASWHASTSNIKQANLGEFDPRGGGNALFLDGHVQFKYGGEFLCGIY